MAWTYEYYCSRLGVKFKKGDKFIIKGQSKVSAYSGSGNGYNYTSNTEKIFYGVYSESGIISYPICIADSAGNSQYYINDACIVRNVSGTPYHHLDLNFIVNGTTVANTSIAKADVYLNGSRVATGVADYYQMQPKGTKWEFKNIVIGSGYTRYSTPTLSGAIGDATVSCNIYIGQNYTITYNANGGSGATTQTVNYGTAWTTKGAICTKSGYVQSSWNTKADGSGTTYALGTTQTNKQTSNLTLYAIYSATGYTNSITHWTFGYKNGEGNNGSKEAYILDRTTFYGVQGSKYPLSSSYATTVPNGFYFQSISTPWMTGSYGSWGNYQPNTQFTQGSSAASFEYNYYPTNYTITYNLNGGEQNSLNPTSYNVLYGVRLHAPIRDGYRFLGWDDGKTIIFGINEGCNAWFNSVDDLYSQLANRRTGNITLTAQWQALTADEKKVYIYNNGNISAAQFRESDTKFGFYNNGTVYAKKFVEGSSQFKVTSDKIMYAKQFIERT